jgi:hypothetical protein
VPKQSVLGRSRPGAAVESVVMATGEVGGLTRGARQSGQERIEGRRVECHRGRQLPKHRAEFCVECQQAGGKEVSERRVDISELLQLGDETAARDRKQEPVRRLTRPTTITGGPLQAVKRTIDLDGAETAGGVAELGSLRQSRRIEATPPARILPPGRAMNTCRERPKRRPARRR